MKIIVHRGTHQIGGCVTEIKSNKTRIIIDMGSELPSSNKESERELEIDGVTVGKKNCDGVFISHYHGDHIGMVNKVLNDVPIYIGHVAHKIFLNLCEYLQDENIDSVRNFRTFKAGEKIILNDLTITPYRVDHSAYDAYMFLIEADGKRILHTGDFRNHGWTGKSLWSLIDTYIKNVDVLITEGTMLSRVAEDVLTEATLCNKAIKLMQDNRNVFVLCSSTNFDSIASFYKAAKTCGKLFVCDGYQRSNLDIVSEYAKSSLYKMPEAMIYWDNREDCIELMRKRGFCMLIRAKKSFKKILELFPDHLFVYSMWHGYIEEGYAKDEDIYNFIPKDNNGNLNYLYLHTSGHATSQTIMELCKRLQPKTIIPIHGEKPEMLKEFDLPNCNIRILNDKEIFDVI